MGKSIKMNRNGVILPGFIITVVLAIFIAGTIVITSCSAGQEAPATQNAPVKNQETPSSQNKTETITAKTEPPQEGVPTPVPEITVITPVTPAPTPVPIPVSPVVPAPILPNITPITPPKVQEDAALKNPTWNEVKDFLLSDNTDKHPYVSPTFVNKNFAETLQNNAKKAGWRCAIVGVHLNWLDRRTGDRLSVVWFLNAFETSDQGIVYIDSTNPSVTPGGDYPAGFTGNAEGVVKLEIGKNYNATFIFPDYYGGELVSNDTTVITGIDPLTW